MPDWGWFGAEATGENEEVTHTSGVQRLCNSMILACIGPFVIMFAIFLTGWNEKRSVCGQKAILAGQDKVQVVSGCDTAQFAGDLVLFSCPYTPGTAVGQPFRPGGDFQNTISFDGIGLMVSTEMRQCIETSTSQTKKNSGGGGGSSTVKTYNYKVNWIEPGCSGCNSDSFHQVNAGNQCGNPWMGNPTLPSAAPASLTQYASSAQIGPYTVLMAYLQVIPLTVPKTPATVPSGWSSSQGWYQSTRWNRGNSMGVGNVRTKFFVHDVTETYTVLGKNVGGTIQRWEAPSDWLCSGFTIGELKVGSISKEVFFETLLDENAGLTFFLRFLCICIFWCGFACIFAPLGVLADCIPCIGPCLGDIVEAVVCICSCPPACACCLFVGAIVWIAMRPLFAIPCMLIGICTPIGYAVFKMQAQKNKENGNGGKVSPGDAEAPPQDAPPQAPAVQQPPAQPVGASYCGQIPQEVAVSLINALREEYVHGAGQQVGAWIDQNPDHQQLAEEKESQVQSADDKEQTIQAIEKEWGLR